FKGSAKAPEAIVLTQGHFDHVGAIKTLAKTWNVPIYADIKEFPYLTGKSHYPPPDPTTGGGSMSLLSFMYPSSPINIGEYLKPFPENGILPEMPEWKVIKTPGHSPGHISLFRESDRTLIAGDAFVTVKQESAIAVMTQKKKLKGPPFYFTCDWEVAKDSVIKLRGLNPEVGATGHGVPMRGEELKQGLKDLTDNFEILGMPSSGRYVKEPAITNEQGVTYLPPAKIKNGTIATVIIGTFVSLTLFAFLNNNEDD
ncbi:MAG: MBL fold metallo-hydrolase, partial [Bacteroidota bacterium]|nr:MBL fold metallo-hydrolase [Bacteroidota bacterium]